MAPTVKFQLVDHRIEGDLKERLLYWRLHKVPLEAMARMITTETGVAVTGKTIADWFGRLDRTPAA